MIDYEAKMKNIYFLVYLSMSDFMAIRAVRASCSCLLGSVPRENGCKQVATFCRLSGSSEISVK